MTPAEILADRVVPFWLAAAEIKGDAAGDAARVMKKRYQKGSGAVTQFNTGALVVRPDRVLALTECQPVRHDASVQIRPPAKSRLTVIDDIRRYGPPLLAVVFKKADFDIAAWVCCTTDEVVLNGPAAPEEYAALEDVAFVRSLKGSVRAWRDAAGLYRAARADLALASKLYAATDKLASANGITNDAALQLVHRLHCVSNLAYALAESPEGRQ